MKTPHQNIIVIYHGGCRDGFGGAWAAWKKFGTKAAYLPAFDRFAPPCKLKGKEIYLIDYTYQSPGFAKKLMQDNVRVTAIDHHITAKDVVELTQNYSFSLHHSGAVLAWNYFHPGRKVPMLLRHIEDGDLWRWKLPRSREIMAYVDLSDLNFVAWSRMASDLENATKRKTYANHGELLLRYEQRIIGEILQGAELVSFAGYKVFAINAPHHFVSDLGQILAKKTNSFALVWREGERTIKVSLRSVGSVDVARIAQRFNGGGHKRAAAFSFKANGKFPWKIIANKKK